MATRIRDRAYMVVSVGICNQEAQDNGEFNGELSEWSNPNSPWNTRSVDTEYATLEQNFFKADGKLTYLPEGEIKQYMPNVGIGTKEIKGSVKITFPVSYDIKGLTINMGRAYATKFEVVTDSFSKEYDNDKEQFETTDNLGTTTSILIKPLEMIGGQQRLRIQNIIMGVGVVFNNATIKSASHKEKISAIDDELPSIDFSVTVADDENIFDVDSTDSFVNYLESGQTVTYSVGQTLQDGSVEYLPLGRLLLTDWNSERGTMSFTASDRFEFLGDKYTEGNYIHTRTLYDDAIAVLTYCGLEPDEYEIDECLTDVEVTNPIPEVSCAEALQLIANAGRCIVYQNRDGLIVFRANFATVIDPTNIVVTSDTDREFSEPHNVLTNVDYYYADMTHNFFSADGSMKFLPENGEGYLPSGFVSESVANGKGEFEIEPALTMQFEAAYTYYGLNVQFKNNAPRKMQIVTYNAGEIMDTAVFDNLNVDTYLVHTFKSFDKMVISFPVGKPNDRVVISHISFGDLTDYRLSYENILGAVKGYREMRVKDLNVKVVSFEESGDKPKEVDDNVYVTQHIENVGQVIEFANPLIGTEEHARNIAKWLGNYYANNVSYNCQYRGDPRLDAADIIFLDSDHLNNLQVEIEEHTLNFNGAFSGTLEMRRALKLMSEEVVNA